MNRMVKRIFYGSILFLICFLAYNLVALVPYVALKFESYKRVKPLKNYDYNEVLPNDVKAYARPFYSTSFFEKLKRYFEPSVGTGDAKIILFWTSWFKKPWWVRLGGSGVDLIRAKCPETRCIFTHDKSKLNEASALLFQSQRIFEEDLPPTRRPDQRWVWVHVEPPTTSLKALATLSPLQGQNEGFSRFFNWTMTYHPDSDILEPYGALVPLRSSSHTIVSSFPTNASDAPTGVGRLLSTVSETMSLRPTLLDSSADVFKKYQTLLRRSPSVEELMASPWSPNLDFDRSRIFTWSYLSSKRPKLVAWVSSHCPTKSRREKYVQELKNYVKVDAYGLCGNLKCGSRQEHRNDRCWKHILARQYLFYLAFENSICDSYITEKLWRPMYYGMVPIVMGGANYSLFLPPNSYINALEYSPQALANLLRDLQESPDFYIQYHLWRVFWKTTLRPPLCEICQRVHNDTNRSISHDIPGWWHRIGGCKNPARWPQDPS